MYLYKNIFNNNFSYQILSNIIFRIFGVGINFLLVRITLSKLGIESYGLWLTLSSIISIFGFTDFGIGLSLKNYIAERYKSGELVFDYIIKKSLGISAVISLSLFIIIFLVFNIFPLNLIFNLEMTMLEELKITLNIIIIGFLINLVLNTSKFIMMGLKKTNVLGIGNLFTQLLSLIIILILTNVSLSTYSLIITIPQVLFNIIISIYILITEKNFFIKSKVEDRKYRIIGSGLKFLILQFFSIIIYSTDNVLINTIFDSKAVADVDLVRKIFGILSTLFTFFLIQLWVETAENYKLNNYIWIRKKIFTANYLLLGIVFLNLMIYLFFNFISKQIYGVNYTFDNKLTFIMAIYFILISWNGIYAYILNGMKMLDLQIIIGIITSITNIPISIFLAFNTNLGYSSVILATILSTLPTSILLPLKVKKILRYMEFKYDYSKENNKKNNTF
jgi:O-antigen/teichoic acid export membrane protein